MPVQDRDEKSDKETERPPHEGAAHSAGNAHSGNAAPGNESAPRGAVAPPDGIVEIDERRAKMERLRAEGIDPYPHVSLPDRTLIVDLIAEHELPELSGRAAPGAALSASPAALYPGAGTARRRSWTCATCRDRFRSSSATTRSGEEAYDRIMGLDIGDIVSVDGCVYMTQRGQLGARGEECTLLTKTLRPPPDRHHGLGDTGTRYRHRELDLIANDETRELFVTRAQDRRRDPASG